MAVLLYLLVTMLLYFSLPEKPVLTPSQFDRISSILEGLGVGVFLVADATPLLSGSGFDNINGYLLLLGLITAVFCWITSISLARKKDDV